MNTVSAWYLIWIIFTTIGFWLTPQKYRDYWLIAATAAILVFISPTSLAFLSALSAATIFIVMQQKHKWIAILIMLTSLCLLTTKLYQRFLQENENIIIPLMFGISYYTLRVIHLLLESYLGKLTNTTSRELMIYLFFPPIIAAGPIQRFDTFKQVKSKKPDSATFAKGMERLLHGFAMIIVLHNTIFKKLLMPLITDLSVTGAWNPTIIEWISCFDYGIGLYLQFSGYSSIAIGFALLLGYHLDENFNWPFLRSSLVMFWRNWHISLSSFCRAYIFTGTLAFSRSIPLAFIASMLAIGLWHSVSANFFLWGIYHGTGLVATQYWLSSKTFDRLTDLIPSFIIRFTGWAFTFNFVILGFAFTKHETLADTLQSWARIFGNG